MKAIGGYLQVAGMIGYFVVGIWGFLLCVGIIYGLGGFWGIMGALILAPVAFVAAPLYAGFADGNWFPLLLCYGGGFASFAVAALGSSIQEAS